MTDQLIVFLSAIVCAVLVGEVIGYVWGYRHGWNSRLPKNELSKKHEATMREIQSRLEGMK